jgi:hypothetical protein
VLLGSYYRDKKVVGVFVRFCCARSNQKEHMNGMTSGQLDHSQVTSATGSDGWRQLCYGIPMILHSKNKTPAISPHLLESLLLIFLAKHLTDGQQLKSSVALNGHAFKSKLGHYAIHILQAKRY